MLKSPVKLPFPHTMMQNSMSSELKAHICIAAMAIYFSRNNFFSSLAMTLYLHTNRHTINLDVNGITQTPKMSSSSFQERVAENV